MGKKQPPYMYNPGVRIFISVASCSFFLEDFVYAICSNLTQIGRLIDESLPDLIESKLIRLHNEWLYVLMQIHSRD